MVYRRGGRGRRCFLTSDLASLPNVSFFSQGSFRFIVSHALQSSLHHQRYSTTVRFPPSRGELTDQTTVSKQTSSRIGVALTLSRSTATACTPHVEINGRSKRNICRNLAHRATRHPDAAHSTARDPLLDLRTCRGRLVP